MPFFSSAFGWQPTAELGGHQLGELATGVQPEAGIPAHTWQVPTYRSVFLKR